MGTRSMTIAIVDKQVKVAQYTQFDGYPSGVGADLCGWIQKGFDRNKLAAALKECRFLSDKEMDALDFDGLKDKDWQKPRYKAFHRETGPEILSLIQDHGVRELCEYVPEPNDCWIEYSYVVDLDKGTLKIWGGVAGKAKNLGTYTFVQATPKAMAQLSKQLEAEDEDPVLYE